jgi:hypothetical protein
MHFFLMRQRSRGWRRNARERGRITGCAQDRPAEIYPRPEAHFADPSAYPMFAKSQFAGLSPYGAKAEAGATP